MLAEPTRAVAVAKSGQPKDHRREANFLGHLLCCNCVHVGVELETCAEALLSAADAKAKPTATNAKMVSLKAMPIRRLKQLATPG